MKTVDFISALINNCKTPEPINNKSDYTRVKKWVKRSKSLYTAFSVISVVLTFIVFIAAVVILEKAAGISFNFITFLAGIVYLLVSVLTGWGFASMILNFKLMVGSVLGAAAAGNRAGEQIQTDHISVRQYGNSYRVTKHTENEGCVMAMIYGFINLFVWAFLCVYVCPFLTFKKIERSRQNLHKFEVAMRQAQI